MYDLRAEDAERIERDFFGRMPGVVKWKERVYDDLLAQGYIESPTGRRRRFPFIPERGSSRAAIFREAVNFLPQSSASDATLLSFIHCDSAGLRPILTVHDSILCDVPGKSASDAAETQREIMERTARDLYGGSVPFIVEIGTGKNWADAEG